MACKTTSDSLVPEIDLAQPIINMLDQLPFPFVIRNSETRIIYANLADAECLGVAGPKDIIGKFECEIDSKLFEYEETLAGFNQQYQQVFSTKASLSNLEIHPHAIDYPYISIKMPFFDAQKECVGIFGYNKRLEVYTLNDYVKGHMPGSLLLNKPDDFFTERQCEIMFYRLQGFKVKEVAARLNLTANTVSNYMQMLYDKVGANNLDEFREFCERRNYHRYLPKRFLTSEAITFGHSIN